MAADPADGEHNFYYRVTENLGAVPGTPYQLTVPRNMSPVEMATVRVGRRGGPTSSDLAFRDKLFHMVGSITVAAGHIEAAMKRLLLVLEGEETVFSLADYQWAELHSRLRKACEGPGERGRELETEFERMPHLVFVPGLVMFITVFALNQLGDRARAFWDTRETNL